MLALECTALTLFMWSTQKLFYLVCTPFTTERRRGGEKSKSGPGLEEKNTTVKERGVEKKDPLKSRDKDKDFRRSAFSTDSGENRCCTMEVIP